MISTVTDKGQVTLPKAIRDLLSISAGTRIDFEVQPDNTLKARVLTRGATGLFGLIAREGEATSIMRTAFNICSPPMCCG